MPNETPKLSLVSDEVYQLGRKPETTSARVRTLRAYLMHSVRWSRTYEDAVAEVYEPARVP